MKSNQVYVIPGAVSCDCEQSIHTVKSRFTGQIVRDLGDGYLRDRVHDDVALFHAVPTSNLHMGARPDANAASDSSMPNSLAQVFAEHHVNITQMATGRRRYWLGPCNGGHQSAPLNSSDIIPLMREIRRAAKQRQVPTVGGGVVNADRAWASQRRSISSR
jgi:hypothetical protein